MAASASVIVYSLKSFSEGARGWPRGSQGVNRAYRFGVQVLAVLVVVYTLQVLAVLVVVYILQVLAVVYILQVVAVLYLFIYFIVDE